MENKPYVCPNWSFSRRECCMFIKGKEAESTTRVIAQLLHGALAELSRAEQSNKHTATRKQMCFSTSLCIAEMLQSGVYLM